jgi:hypothetical protein
LVFGLLFLWKRKHDKPRPHPEPPARVPSNVNLIILDPTNPNIGHIMRQIAGGTPGNGDVRAIMPPRAQDAYGPGTGQVYRLPSYASSYVYTVLAYH